MPFSERMALNASLKFSVGLHSAAESASPSTSVTGHTLKAVGVRAVAVYRFPCLIQLGQRAFQQGGKGHPFRPDAPRDTARLTPAKAIAPLYPPGDSTPDRTAHPAAEATQYRQSDMVSRLLLSRLVQHLLREIECGDVASGRRASSGCLPPAASGIQYVPETTRTE